MKQIRIYISGKITGLPVDDTRQKFSDVQDLLESIGFDVVNPMESGLPDDATWEEHMEKDFGMLLSCDAIYMMDNWGDSVGASIEYDVAKRLGKKIFFESSFFAENQLIVNISNAIHEATGLSLSDYSTKSRRRESIYARMLFVHHCRLHGMTLSKIAGYIGRSHSSVIHMLGTYDGDFRYNPRFRDIALKINRMLGIK